MKEYSVANEPATDARRQREKENPNDIVASSHRSESTRDPKRERCPKIKPGGKLENVGGHRKRLLGDRTLTLQRPATEGNTITRNGGPATALSCAAITTIERS